MSDSSTSNPTSSSSRNHRLNELFDEAYQLPPTEREAFLRAASGNDTELVNEVLAWLFQADRSDFASPFQQEQNRSSVDPDAEKPLLKCPKCGCYSLKVSIAADSFVCESGVCDNRFELRPDADRPPVLAKVSTYEIIGLLGQGGFGRVWFARDSVNGQYVALKIPLNIKDRARSESFISETRRAYEFLNEPRAARRIPRLVGAGEDSGIPYIAFEFLNARPLSDLIASRGHELSSRRCMEIMLEVANTLQIAHNNNFIHRDVKPGNVLVSSDGSVYVTDFGISKDLKSLDPNAAENDSEFAGTIQYSSPEHVTGSVDPRSDIFSMGIMLFELVSGQHPFPADSPIRQLNAIAAENREALRLADVAPGVDPKIDQICCKCLKKRRSERYPSAGALANDLQAFLNDESVPSDGFSSANRLPTRITSDFSNGNNSNFGSILKTYFLPVSLIAVLFLALILAAVSSIRDQGAKQSDVMSAEDLVSVELPDGMLAVEISKNLSEQSYEKIKNSSSRIRQVTIKATPPLGEQRIDLLGQFPQLRRLTLDEVNLTREDIRQIVELEKLDELVVFNSGRDGSLSNGVSFTHDFISEVVQTPNSESRYRIPFVSLTLANHDEDQMRDPWRALVFAGLETMDDERYLKLTDTYAAHMQTVCELWLFQTRISNEKNLDFESFKSLKRLFVSSSRSVTPHVAALQLPDGLEWLIMQDLMTSDLERESARKDIATIDYPQSLTRIDYNSFGRFDGRELAFLSSLANLQRISLDDIKLDEESISILNRLDLKDGVWLLDLTDQNKQMLQKLNARFHVFGDGGRQAYRPRTEE